MRCARCASSLVEERYESARLHACPHGHGALLTKEARGTLTVSARATLEEALERPGLLASACASCGAGTHGVTAHRHGDGIELDACLGCGAVWFDAGELARLHHVPERAQVARAAGGASTRQLHGDDTARFAGFAVLEGVGGFVAALLSGW